MCAIRIRQGAHTSYFVRETLVNRLIAFLVGVQAVAESATPLFKTLETTWRFHPASSASSSLHQSGAPSTPSRSQQGKEVRSQVHSLAAAPDDVGPTLVSLELSFAFANPVHAAVSGAFFGKVSGLMVKAFDERCLKVYGASRRERVT